MKILSLFVLLVCATASTNAAPILHRIDFTGSGGVPLTGSFAYDSSTQLFSSFIVLWNSDPFDLTSSANAASVSGTCATAAPDAEDYYNYLSGNGCAGQSWLVFGLQTLPPSQTFRLGSFPVAYAQQSGPGTGAVGLIEGGEFTISAVPDPSPVPEPSPLALMMLAGAAGVLSRQQRKRTASR